MTWEKKRLLIWGTTYPQFSNTYYETVCTGAVDEATGKFVRIYPITLRYLNEPFSHYDWIEAEVERNTSDFRPESHRIRQDTIEVRGKIGTVNGWAERSQWIIRPSNVFASLSVLRDAEERDHTSLGLVKPKQVKRIYSAPRSEADRAEWNEARDRAQVQKEMFVDEQVRTKDLQFVPIRYYVDFICEDEVHGEKLHKCAVLDWGVYVLHRRMCAEHGAAVAPQKVIDRITTILDPAKKDAYLFMGNSMSHCQNFSIVGFYYPPLPKLAKNKTLSLPGFD